MIGKDQTLKVILSSYIAILASDAISNIISRVMFGGAVAGVLVIPSEQKALILIKIALFVFLTVALTTRGAFEILVAEERSPFMRMMMTFSYGILSAGLIISTILVYVSGASLIGTAVASGNPIEEIASTSRLVQLMIHNYAVWFSLPALAFVVASLFGNES
ncbi:hypothetical protein IPN35_04730 [Candidatus Peregrinibacteria bacterium]|nr:MAG: hypothetical protein IPN35_04730 [Candidatus Peregrinibacteria bacterium]